jgi:PilZ domain
MLRSTSISLQSNNKRRDQRYGSPAVRVVVGTSSYDALNWSLGGALLCGPMRATVGSRLVGSLRIAGRANPIDVAAEVLRCDPGAGTIACRFVAPSEALVGALDAAVARRLRGRGSAFGAALALGMMVAAPHAVADGPGSDALVPGGFPLPEFRLNFPDRLDEPLATGTTDLRISLTSPDQKVLHFLFSPRSEFAMATDPGTGTSRSSIGLSWNLFRSDGFFGNFGVAGSFTHTGIDDVYRRYFGPPLALHGTFEFGYQLGTQHSLMLLLDHATAPDLFGEHNDLDNFQIRYGLKF